MFYSNNKPIWIICDRGPQAGDNGYKFFLFMKKEHPEVDSYFLVSKTAPEWKELDQYSDSRLEFNSLKHLIYLWRAKYLVSTHIQGYFPFRGLGLWIKKIYPFYNKKKHVFLQHGVSYNYNKFLEYSNTQIDLFLCAIPMEVDFIIDRYGYPKDKVVLTGFSRFDSLVDESKDRRQILLVPTWREYIYKAKGFEETDYFKAYSSLITSKRLADILEKNDMTLIFYPHHEMQCYLSSFENLDISPRVHVANENECPLAAHLRQSNVMITDYSSVIFDFAYMNKPILLYQFDRDMFLKGHCMQGWLDYDHSVGPVCNSENVLLDTLEKLIERNLLPDDEYLEYAEKAFLNHDRGNSERIYQAIINLN